MNAQERELIRFLRLLDRLGCLRHVMLIGSWAEAYVVHKMVVNKERGKKQEKDALAILRMWPFLDPGMLGEVFAKLTRKERSRVISFLEAHGLHIS